MKLALIFASLLAVAFARIEVTQQLDGSMVEIIDDVIPSRDGTGIFKRSVLDGGLGFGMRRERRQVDLICRQGSYATTKYYPGTTLITCLPNLGTHDCNQHGVRGVVIVGCK